MLTTKKKYLFYFYYKTIDIIVAALESRFDEAVYRQLAEAGHDVERIGEYDDVMGHAGALVHHPDGLIEAAADPRSDGVCAGF